MQATCLALGSKIAYFRSEHSHSRKVAAHHQKRSDEYGQFCAEYKQHDIACTKPEERYGRREGKSLFVIDLAPKCSGDRCQNDGGSHYEDVIDHAERYLIINNKVGHKDLDRNVEDYKCDEIEVQVLVFFDRRRAEAVNDIAEIAGL